MQGRGDRITRAERGRTSPVASWTQCKLQIHCGPNGLWGNFAGRKGSTKRKRKSRVDLTLLFSCLRERKRETGYVKSKAVTVAVP